MGTGVDRTVGKTRQPAGEQDDGMGKLPDKLRRNASQVSTWSFLSPSRDTVTSPHRGMWTPCGLLEEHFGRTLKSLGKEKGTSDGCPPIGHVSCRAWLNSMIYSLLEPLWFD